MTITAGFMHAVQGTYMKYVTSYLSNLQNQKPKEYTVTAFLSH